MRIDMENWRVEIEKFDEDLKSRMVIIRRNERTGLNLDRFVLKGLGFSMRGLFPWWRDHTKEWRNRNRNRVNESGRVQQKSWRLKNNVWARERERNYYRLNREKILGVKRLARKKRLLKLY